MPTIGTYRQFGGVHPETAALANVLAANQIVAPHTGRPFSEAMLFGISGGLGMGYMPGTSSPSAAPRATTF